MLVVSIDYVPDKEIILLGLVQGSTMYSKHTLENIQKTSSSHEQQDSTHYLTMTRNKAIQAMITEAEKLDAHAIINVRFSSSHPTPNTDEIFCYGTAVQFKYSETLQQF